MHTPLCEASGPMLAQQYCSCMAVVYNDACSQTCGEGRQQFKVLVRTGTGGVLSCGEGRQQFKVLLGLANCAGASLMHCTKLGWIGVYTFAKFASALVNFSYKCVDGNTTFNDRPLTDLKIKCVQS